MAERERGHLGMTHNPFAQPSAGFFERGDCKAHLDLLGNVDQWGCKVLLVTGPRGAGKSVLYRESRGRLAVEFVVARVVGTLVNTRREVLSAVAQGLGGSAQDNANSSALASLIARSVGRGDEADPSCVVLVDDADALEPDAIEALFKLTGETSLRLVLFGEAHLAPTVERVSARLDVECREIPLAGLNGGDARDYLEWRFAEAKYRGRLPFTDQQVSEVVRLGEGFPGKMNQLANALLAKLETGELRAQPARFPPQHRVLAVLVALVAGLAYLIWHQAPPQSGAVEVVRQPEADAVEPDDREDAEPARIVVEPVRVADHRSDPTSAKPLPGDAELSAEVSERQLQPVLEEPQLQVQVVESLPEGGQHSAAWHDEAWLLQQSPGTYTIQLVSVSSAERAHAYVLAQPDPGQMAVYRLQRDGRELHVILYGIYVTQEEARIEADRLPESVGSVRPWVRSMAQVQRAMGGA